MQTAAKIASISLNIACLMCKLRLTKVALRVNLDRVIKDLVLQLIMTSKTAFYFHFFLYLRYRQSVIKDYIMWRVVSKYVLSMPDQFVEAYLSYTEAVLGVQEYERWSSCIEGMMKPMDMTLGRMYVDADFDETTKTTVNRQS